MILVACSKKKAKVSSPVDACQLYRGQFFVKAAQWAERQSDPYYILSAKYGLLHRHRPILPYDESLPRGRRDRGQWALHVAKEIKEIEPPPAKITFITGQRYYDPLAAILQHHGYEARIVLAGLRYGEKLRALNEMLVS